MVVSRESEGAPLDGEGSPSGRESISGEHSLATTPSSSKHGASLEAASPGKKRGKKRNRVMHSCTECHRRKQKCDRQTPCQHCIARKIPHLCMEFRPGYEMLGTDERISRLERVVDGGLQRIFAKLEASQVATGQDAVASSSSSFAGPSKKRKHADAKVSYGDLPGPSVGSPNGDASKDDEYEAAQGRDEINDSGIRAFEPLSTTLPYDSASSTWASLRDHLRPGTSKARLSSSAHFLLEQLPPAQDVRKYIDYYFENVNWLFLLVPERELRVAAERLLGPDANLDASTINVFATVCAMAAMGAYVLPNELFGENINLRAGIAKKLHDLARHALWHSAFSLKTADLEQVTAWYLCSLFLATDGRTSEALDCAAKGVMAAFTLDLHREPRLSLLSEKEDQARRRVWTMIYFWEKSLCLTLDKPSVTQDRLCTSRAMIIKSQEPNELSHVVHLHALVPLMGRANCIIQTTDGNDFHSEAERLDRALQDFHERLPPWFQSRVDPEKDEVCPRDDAYDEPEYNFLASHRYLLETEVNAVRIALMRPFINGDAAAHCRRVSMQCARHSILTRQQLVKVLQARYGAGKVPRAFRIHASMSKRLEIVLTCCVLLLLDPLPGTDNISEGSLRRYIEEYLGNLSRRALRFHAENDYRSLQYVERESKVLRLFLDRADRKQRRASGFSSPFVSSKAPVRPSSSVLGPMTGPTTSNSIYFSPGGSTGYGGQTGPYGPSPTTLARTSTQESPQGQTMSASQLLESIDTNAQYFLAALQSNSASNLSADGPGTSSSMNLAPSGGSIGRLSQQGSAFNSGNFARPSVSTRIAESNQRSKLSRDEATDVESDPATDATLAPISDTNFFDVLGAHDDAQLQSSYLETLASQFLFGQF